MEADGRRKKMIVKRFREEAAEDYRQINVFA
jgi:hypothetical protein